MQATIGSLTALVIPVVAIVMVFTFIMVVSWAEERRKEREAYYRSETLRKAMEQNGDSSRMVLDLMREEDLLRRRRRVEGLRLGGTITAAVGVGLMVMLYFLVDEEPVWLVGLIPFLIGAVIAGHGYTTRPDPPPHP
jgi:hypothetical protein